MKRSTESRLKRLEKEMKTWRLAALGLAGAGLIVGLTGAAAHTPKAISAQEIDLVDAAGKVRVEFAMTVSNMPLMKFYDQAGNTRASLILDPDGAPGLGLYDVNSVRRTAIGFAPDGTPVLALFDADKHVRLRTGLAADGTPAIQFADPTGTMTWHAQ